MEIVWKKHRFCRTVFLQRQPHTLIKLLHVRDVELALILTLLNELAEEISYPLAKIFQASLESGRLPKDWLTATVSPIYKGGQRVDPKNVRPVSLTSTSSKVMERIIKFALVQFADSQQLMSKRQHGFLHGAVDSGFR